MTALPRARMSGLTGNAVPWVGGGAPPKIRTPLPPIAEVRGGRAALMLSPNSSNSRLKASSYETVVFTRELSTDPRTPVSVVSNVGMLLRNGDGKVRWLRRSGEQKQNSPRYAAMPGRTIHPI